MTTRGKKRLALLLIIVVAAAAAVYGARTLRRAQLAERITEAKAAGEAARAEGDHVGAVNELGFYLIQTARKNDGQPVDGEAWLEWADSRKRIIEENNKHLPMAIDGARNAATLLPDDPRPKELLLELYGQTARFTERLEIASDLLADDAAHREANEARALSLWRLGREQEAVEAAREMVARRPGDLGAHELLIELMLIGGAEADELRAHAEDAASRHPEDLGFTLLAARTAAAVGDVEAARRHAEKASAMPVEEADQFRMLLAMLDALQMEEASAALEERELSGASPGDERIAIAAERAWRLGQPGRAQEIMATEGLDPGDASEVYLGWWAMLSLDERSAEDARPHPAIEALEERDTEAAAAWLSIIEGYRAMRLERWGEARDHLNAAIATGERSDIAEYLLGEAERSLGERQVVIDRWKRLALRDGRWVGLRLSLAQLLMLEGEHVEAFSYAARALASAPNQAVAAPTLARAAVGVLEMEDAPSDMVAAAVEFLEACRETYAEVDEMMAVVARGLAAQEREEESEEIVRRLIERGGTLSAESLASLLQLNRAEGWGLESSLRALGEEREMSPALAFVLAVEAAERGQSEQGLRLIREAAREAPESQSLAYERRVAMYMDMVDHPEALERFRSLAETHGQNGQIQTEFLRSRTAWRDPDAVRAAISRLRTLAGEESLSWRVFEARRLLRYEPTEANAARVEMLLRPVVEKASGDTAALTLVAEARLISGDTNRAIDSLIEAVEVDGEDARLYPRLIALLQQQGRTQEAERFLGAFSELEEIGPDMRRRRAQLLAAQGLWRQAAADYEALGEEQTEEDLLALAGVRLRQGDFAAAGEIFEDLIARPSASMAAIRGAAQYYAASGRLDRAEQVLAEASDDPPGRRARIAAYFWEQQGDSERASERFRAYAEARGTGDAWAEVVSYHLRSRSFDEASEALEAGLAAAPENEALRMASRTIELGQGGELNTSAVGDLVAGLGAGAPAEAAEKTLEALAALQRDPSSIEEHIERLREVTSEHPTFFPAWRLLAASLVERGRTDEALDAATQAASVLPTDPRPRRLATEILMMRGERQRALAAARQWRERSLEDPIEADVTMASLEQNLGQPSVALERLLPHRARIVAQADRQPARLTLLAQLLAANGRLEEAESLILPRAEEDAIWAARALGVALALADRPRAALVWIERVEPMLEGDPVADLRIGQALYDVGMATADERFFREVIERLEGRAGSEGAAATAAALTGASYEALDRYADAERLYRLAAESPDASAAVLNNLAYLLLKMNQSTQEAYELSRRAVESAPQNATFLDTEGVALLALGRYEEAEEVFEEALRLSPSEPGLLLGVAEALHGQGDTPGAEAALSRMEQAMRTSGPLAPEVRDRLARLREALSEGSLSSAGG